MARYRLNAKIFLKDQLLEAGTEVDFDGEPNSAMDPIDDAAVAAVADREARLVAKAGALKAGLGASSDPAVVEMVNIFTARLEAAEIKLAEYGVDIDELDAGMQMVTGRVDDLEGVLTAAAKPATKPKPKPAPIEEFAPQAVEPAPVVEEAAPVTEPTEPPPAV